MKKVIQLGPGEFYFGGGEIILRTLLGSCVAVTMWHPARHIGGMCHYLLPGRSAPTSGASRMGDGSYAEEAVAMLHREALHASTRPAEYQVKLFGGGNQFRAGAGAHEIDVPRRNIDAGIELLARYGFLLSDRHVGQTGPRKLALDLSSGEVYLRHAPRVLEVQGS